MIIVSNQPAPTEGVRFIQNQTSAVLEDRNLGQGTIYVTEGAVSWIGPEGNGFSLNYPSISLHAISRDQSTYPEECLYVMVEAPAAERRILNKQCTKPSIYYESMTKELAGVKVIDPDYKSDADTKADVTGESGSHGVGQNGIQNGDGGGEGEEGREGEEEEELGITQIRFVPMDKSILDEMFKAMSDCQALHPDEEDEFSDGGFPEEEEGDGEGEGVEVLGDDAAGDGQWYSSPDDVVHLNEEGQAVLNRILANQGGGDVQNEEEENMDTNEEQQG